MQAHERMLIIVGVDGSAAADRALAWAARIGHRLGATVEMVTAWTADHLDTSGKPILPLSDEESARRVQNETAARVLPGGGGTPVAMTVDEGASGPVLVDAARGADLLVVGSHGHRRYYSALLGSTSEYCIRRAECPVVIVSVPVHQPEAAHDALARQG